MRAVRVAILASSLSACAGVILAQTPPMAADFQVNSYTTSYQNGYGIAMDRAGNFVVAWDSYGQDADGYGIFARRFDAGGAAQGGDFQANSYTTGYQEFPTVAMDPSGRFVVVWQSYQDGGGYGIFGQRFDKSGAPLGSEFPVNTYTTGAQKNAFVAADGGGNFIVVWNSVSQDGSDEGAFGQRFDNSGTPVGSEFQINTYTSYAQVPDGVAMDAAGNFVVVWEGDGSSGYGIFARRYNSSGVAQGAQFQVSAGTGYYASVAMDRAGDFVVAWEGTDGAGAGIRAKRFDSSGAAVGSEFGVNTYSTGDQGSPSVAMDGSGNFLVAWESQNQDGSSEGVFARRYDRFGAAVSSEFAVNAYTTGFQGAPLAATTDTGSFVIAWQDAARDGSNYGVFARRSALSAAASIKVDAHSGAGTASDVNGVLEPGETVLVEPAWSNGGTGTVPALTGAASGFSGPPGATYTLNDGTAAYGSVAAGGTTNCLDAGGDCYEVTVSNPASRPAGHWDVQMQENLSAGTPKTWTLHVGGSFTDVPSSQPFYGKIETLLHNGITAGCTPTAYCPGSTVTRSQMSLFVGRGIAGSGAAIPASGKVGANAYNCKAAGVSLFTDVPPTDIACKSVHYIASQNVTLGCSPTTYCPGNDITRREMAAFVAKAIVAPQGGPGVPLTYGPDPVTGLSYSCDSGSPNTHFADVPASDVFCKHVHFLWAKGIIAGCSATQYCPGDPVTRDAMAKFLGNAFALPLYGP